MFLCKDCCRFVGDNPREHELFCQKIYLYKEKLKKFKEENLAKQTKYHKQAASIIEKISNVFGMRVEHERIMPPYMIDIYIKRANIGIEIDGGYHNDRADYDERRDAHLSKFYNTIVYRFKNEDVPTEYFRLSIWGIFYSAQRRFIRRANRKALEKNIFPPDDFIKIGGDNKINFKRIVKESKTFYVSELENDNFYKNLRNSSVVIN